MLKDVKGVKFERGDVLKAEDGQFQRVLYVGETRIITACDCRTEQEARTAEYGGASWTQEGLNNREAIIVSRRPLGVYDSEGMGYWYGDEIMCWGEKRVVFDAVPSRNGDGHNYIFVEAPRAFGGWAILKSESHTILPKSKPETLDITITKNGKPYDGKLSVETLREMGVCEKGE